MIRAAQILREMGFVLRSGGADGADSWFEAGAGSDSEIYLPWPGYNGHPSGLSHVCDRALEIARSHHPAWRRCSPAGRKLLGRNCYQILGPDLESPSEFVICWTPEGKITGGTGQALRVAQAHGIPIFNLAADPELSELARFLNEST